MRCFMLAVVFAIVLQVKVLSAIGGERDQALVAGSAVTFHSLQDWKVFAAYESHFSLRTGLEIVGRTYGNHERGILIPEGRPWCLASAVVNPSVEQWHVLLDDLQSQRVTALFVGEYGHDSRYQSSANFIEAVSKRQTPIHVRSLKFVTEGDDSSRRMAVISQIAGLEVLDLSESQINTSSLRPMATCRTIESLDVSWTQVDNGLVEIIDNFPQLKSLGVGHTQISGVLIKKVMDRCDIRRLEAAGIRGDMFELHDCFPSKSIEELDLTDSIIDSRLAQKILASPQLTSISLKRTAIDDDAFLQIGDLTRWRSIDVGSCEISDKTSELFSQMKNIELIDISECKGISDGVIRRLWSLPKLREINLSGTGISNTALQGVGDSPALQSLCLGKARIDDEKLELLGACRKLKSLTLNGCEISSSGLQHLSECKEIERLDFSDSQFSGPIAKGVGSRSQLRMLVLSETNITSDDLEEVIRQCPHIESLVLSGDQVTDDVLKAIATLKDLRVAFVPVSDDVTAAGVESLVACNKLQSLYLSFPKETVASEAAAKLEREFKGALYIR